LHVKKWSTSLFESDLTQFWLNSPLIAMADVRSVTDHADGVKKQALTALPPGSEERRLPRPGGNGSLKRFSAVVASLQSRRERQKALIGS